jgi:predicted GNAT family acetyltransferase
MNDLPDKLFANPIWNALRTTQRNFAISAGQAVRYPADVVPFAAVGAFGIHAMQELRSLLSPGDSTWVIAEEYAQIPELVRDDTIQCFQMVLPNEIAPLTETIELEKLSEKHAQEMVALTTLAFPGYFRVRSCEMGTYYGVRSPTGELIAMGGERFKVEEYSEISAVCTHPEFRGRGLAASIMWQIVRDHRRDGIVSWLHVGCKNIRAVELYRRMGFQTVRTVTLHRVSGRY